MAPFFTDDAEFYHDITGLTRTRSAVVASMMNGPCGTQDLRMRREIVADSVIYNPVPGYGAILAGDHIFYARHGDAPERAETRARFMTVWRLDGGVWRMARIVSYDHQPVPYVPPAAGMNLTPQDMQRYVGHYATQSGDVAITIEDGRLVLRSGGLMVTLGASARDKLFARERDLQLGFDGTDARAGTIDVIEGGKIVAHGNRTHD